MYCAGQKKFRYDLAGFVTTISQWPITSKAKLSFLVSDGNGGEKWVEEHSSICNLLITNLPELGEDHPIYNGELISRGCLIVLI